MGGGSIQRRSRGGSHGQLILNQIAPGQGRFLGIIVVVVVGIIFLIIILQRAILL